jgi:hypothetical protein
MSPSWCLSCGKEDILGVECPKCGSHRLLQYSNEFISFDDPAPPRPEEKQIIMRAVKREQELADELGVVPLVPRADGFLKAQGHSKWKILPMPLKKRKKHLLRKE